MSNEGHEFNRHGVCRGSTSPLATHVLPSLRANDISKLLGESPVIKNGVEKRTLDYPRGCAPSVGRPQQEDSPCKMSKSDNSLTP